MKPGNTILFTAMLVLTACSAASSTSKKELKDAEFEQTASLIKSGSFQFTLRSASPAGAGTIQLSSLYVLKARNGSYRARLPYFGRAYSGGYGENGAIEFNGEPEDPKISGNEKRRTITLDFTIPAEKERYTVTLTVGASGYGNLVISSSKRQTITYAGLAGPLQD